MSPIPPLWSLSATELGRRFRAGECTPVQLLDSLVARINALNPLIHALVTPDLEGARRAAMASAERWARSAPLGPLDGIAITIKDNIEQAGLRCTWGSRLFAGHVPQADELPVARLRAEGMVLLGKTNASEFAMQGHTDNEVFGVTRNPWSLALSVGGSSGGAVACVAAGLGPLALGTDGGGSIRRPAAHTGLVGFKPSRGRVPRAGGLPAIFLDYEVVGPIARCVDDVILLMQALSPFDRRDPGSWPFEDRPLELPQTLPRLRILHVPQFGDAPVDAEIAALTDQAADRLAGLGHRVERAGHWPLADRLNGLWMSLAQVGLARMLAERGPAAEGLSPIARASAQAGQALPATALFELLAEVETMKRQLSLCFADFDLLLTPATAALPWTATDSYPDRIAGQSVGPRGHAVFTAFANAAGLPAIALPGGFSELGLPNGLQLVAPWGQDERLLALAREYEVAYPWAAHWPPRFGPDDSVR